MIKHSLIDNPMVITAVAGATNPSLENTQPERHSSISRSTLAGRIHHTGKRNQSFSKLSELTFDRIQLLLPWQSPGVNTSFPKSVQALAVPRQPSISSASRQNNSSPGLVPFYY